MCTLCLSIASQREKTNLSVEDTDCSNKDTEKSQRLMGSISAIFIALTILLLSCSSFTMNHCRRSLHLLTGSFPSTPQSKSYARYASSISNNYAADSPTTCEGEREGETVAMAPEEVRYDNVTEGLRQLNGSWEFGTFNHKSQPTLKDLEDFEATKLKAASTLRTDTNWVNKLTDEEVDRGIAELSKYCSKERIERFELVLSKRTSSIRMVSGFCTKSDAFLIPGTPNVQAFDIRI